MTKSSDQHLFLNAEQFNETPGNEERQEIASSYLDPSDPMNCARVVMRQIQDIVEKPIEGIKIRPTDDLHVIEVEMRGPEDTPFANGVFEMCLVLDDNYPDTPPKGFFKTKIFHPNISDPRGEICVNTLKRDWERTLGLRHVLAVVRCLLIEPNPESALNEEAGKLLLENYAEYFKRAKMMTMVHAMPQGGSVPTNSAAASCSGGNNNTSNPQANGGAQQRTVGEQDPNTMNTAASSATAGNSNSSADAENNEKSAESSKAKAVNDKRRAMLKRL